MYEVLVAELAFSETVIVFVIVIRIVKGRIFTQSFHIGKQLQVKMSELHL